MRCLRVDVDAIYLVDEEGDEEFNKSRWYGSDGKTVLPATTGRCDSRYPSVVESNQEGRPI